MSAMKWTSLSNTNWLLPYSFFLSVSRTQDHIGWSVQVFIECYQSNCPLCRENHMHLDESVYMPEESGSKISLLCVKPMRSRMEAYCEIYNSTCLCVSLHLYYTASSAYWLVNHFIIDVFSTWLHLKLYTSGMFLLDLTSVTTFPLSLSHCDQLC